MKTIFIYVGILLQARSFGQSVQYFFHLKTRNAYKAIVGIYPTPKPHSGNFYEIRYNAENKPIEVTYLNNNQMTASPEFGTAQMKIRYTDTAEYRHFFDEHGKRVTNNGVYVEKYMYNKQKFRIRCDFLDSLGQIIESTSNGAQVYFENDQQGRIIRETQKDLNGKIVPRGSVNYYQTGFIYDSNDMMIEIYNIDANGSRCANNIGLSAMKMKWNAKGKETEWTYHDIKGNIMNRSDINFAKGVYTIDEKGKILSISYLDEHDKPSNYRNTVAFAINFFDQNGNITEQRFYDKHLTLVDAPWTKAAIIRFSRNENGIKEEKFISTYFK